MPNERQKISQDDLSAWITDEVQKHEGCEELKILGVYKLAELDPNGNNWSVGHARVTGVPAEIYGPAFEIVIGKAKELFNLL